MHVKNGLLNDLDYGFTRDEVDRDIAAWLPSGTDHIPFGGSGVLHFDRKFIDKYLPRLGKRITYWAYDVGPIRRTASRVGYPWLSQDAKTHRALDDARFHAEEFRYATQAFGRMKSR
jgi:oligoribonuclease (3'-5' exoribonuclease)